MLLRLLATRWTVATPNAQRPAPISSSRCRLRSMISPPLLYFARASLASRLWAWPGANLGAGGPVGFGAAAHLAIEVLHAWKGEVYVSTRGESHRKLAESMGAKWVGAETDKPTHELDRALTFAPSGDLVVAAR